MKFDPSKPVQTRDGRPARIICIDRIGDNPIIALVTKELDTVKEFVHSYHKNGRYLQYENHDADLVNVPQKIHAIRYINVYDGDKNVGPFLYSSKEIADGHASSGRIACLPVVIEGVEGQGI